MTKMLSDLLPQRDNQFLTWLDITPASAVKTLPATKDKPCDDAKGIAVNVEICEVKRGEWEFAAGRKQVATGLRFKARDGLSKWFTLTSTKNAWKMMSLFGTVEEDWVGKTICLYVDQDRSPNGGKCNCLRIKGVK